MAAEAEEIRKYLLQIDKDSNITITDVQQKLLTFVNGLIPKNDDVDDGPKLHKNANPLLAVDSALIDETLDEIDENEQKYEHQLRLRERTPEVPLTEEEFEDDVPKKTKDFW